MLPNVDGTERGGFEPPNGVNPRYAISSRAHSTALAPLLGLAARQAVLVGYDTTALRARRAIRAGWWARYDTKAFAVGRLPGMLLLATSPAVSEDIGLLITFLGIGVLVNLILVFVFVLVRGEHQQNQDRR